MIGTPGIVKCSLWIPFGPATAFLLIPPILSATSTAAIDGNISIKDSSEAPLPGIGILEDPV